MPSTNPPPAAANDSDSEEDYMKMDFSDPSLTSSTTTSKPETSLQRRLRLQREGEARARVKSKAELAVEAEEARERALRTSLLDDEKRKASSKGFAMMAKMGFKGGALGRKSEEKKKDGEDGGDGRDEGEGERERERERERAEPIRIEVKDDRGGIGMESERKRKLKEVAEEMERQGKKVKADEEGYRERVRREREEGRLERLVAAAQKVAERMDEEVGDGVVAMEDEERAEGEKKKKEKEKEKKKRGVGSRPLKSVNVLWRGLVRARDEAERDRRMRYDLEQSLSRLPTYEDEDEDEDDKRAMGKSKTLFEVAEDLDEEDPELDEFNALPAEEKLRRLVEHLRKSYRYCFWCKFKYPDEGMEGCPGLTEEDHD